MRGYIPPEPDPGPLLPNSSMSQKTKELIEAAKEMLARMTPEAHEAMYQLQRENYAKSFAKSLDDPQRRQAYQTPPANPEGWRFRFGDKVYKPKGSWWEGYVVGFYSTVQTPRGYAVQLEISNGPVQIYPEDALEFQGR